MDDAARPEPLLVVGMGWFPDQPGGLNRYVHDELEAWWTDGVDATAVVIGPASSPPARVVAAGRHDQPFPARLALLARTLRPRRAEVVDAHWAVSAAVALLSSRGLRRARLVVHFHGPAADEARAAGGARWLPPVLRWVERRVYRHADAVVAMSAAFGRVAIERYGVSPWKLRVIPPGVDTRHFSPGDRIEARQTLDLPPDTPVVVTARRLVPRMGVTDLVDAVADLPEAVLLVVGDGPERAALEARAATGPGAGRIRFTGRVTEERLVAAYRAADVAVVPSRELEGFGLTALEALACGTPVVVTDVGGLPAAVEGLDGDPVVPAGDRDALRSRVGDALSGVRPLAGPDACVRHAHRFSWPAVIARHRPLLWPGDAARRHRVVFLDHTALLSGGELALARVLPHLDLDSHVIVGEDGPLVARLGASGISVEVLPLDRSAGRLGRDRVAAGRLPLRAVAGAGSHLVRLTRRLRQLDPDVVVTNSLKAALYGGLAGRVAGIPVVWHVRDRVSPDYLPATAVRLVRGAAQVLPSAIVANSTRTLETLPRPRVPARVVPSPVDVTHLADLRHRRPADGPTRFVVVGRLAPWKGQDLFVEAFARAFPTGRQSAVIVGGALFGEEDFVRALDDRIQALDLAARIERIDHVDDIRPHLRGADVLVHPSRLPEPFGQVVVEALAAGLPVVTTGGGAADRFVRDGDNGLVVPPGDPAALAEALRRADADHELRRRAARRADDDLVAVTPAAVAGRLSEIIGEVR